MNQILKVFISSTAIDLKDHRKAVSDEILRMKHLPVGMEQFGAMSQPPIEACRKQVLDSDILVVFVAHRLGWVPRQDQGGNGKKSITWFEVETALGAEIPVLAFLIDPKHPWQQPKEQDLLTAAETDEDMLRVGRNVKSLTEFRSFLQNDAGLVCDEFTNPDNLAKKVAQGLSTIPPRVATRTNRRDRPPADYRFHVYHPLQPATHFQGRQDVLFDLEKWWKDPAHADRIKSLVAIGGTGKTAIAAEFLRRIKNDTLSGHVFEWSFYEDPNTDSFLYEACAVFLGEQETEGTAGGRLARLERALRDGAPHLFILDGLERIQSEGKSNRAYGELDDHQLKNFLRCIAGGLGRTRALVTTRFRMTDLVNWEHAGHRTYELKHLDPPSAVAVLKDWGVRGSDERLAALARELGYHALSVSVLGSYLHEIAGGDPDQAPSFEFEEAAHTGAEGAKLGRILKGYAEALPKEERDLLVRLSVFPRGVSVEILGFLVNAGGEVAGHLIGSDDMQLIKLANKLSRLGLVFDCGVGDDVRFSAHPFLREYFRQLVGVDETTIHETVRSALAPSLESQPSTKPRDRDMLDRYEELIEYTLGAGDADTAFDLYWNGLGHHSNLGWKLGEYARGARVLSQFTENGDPGSVREDMRAWSRTLVASDWGFYTLQLGDLSVAERAYTTALESYRSLDSPSARSRTLLRTAQLLEWRGNLPRASSVAQQSLEAAQESETDPKRDLSNAYSFYASTAHLLGETAKARELYAKATESEGGELVADRGIREADHLFDLHQFDQAIAHTENNVRMCQRYEWNFIIAHCYYLLGRVAVLTSTRDAQEQLGSLRERAYQTGHMASTLEGHHLAAEIALASGDVQSALDEAQIGMTLAEGSGFGLLAIKLLLSQSRAYLTAPDPRAALGKARDALERASRDDCRYAWGIADAAHVCGVAHLRLDERDLAKRRFAQALEVRLQIEHPKAEKSRAEFEKLS